MKTSVKQVIAVIAIVAIIAASLPIAAFGMAETNANVQPDEIWDGSIAEGFAGGTGTEADPYLISNGAELAYLAQQTNSGISYQGSYFALTNDIYLNDTTDWESWGNDMSVVLLFRFHPAINPGSSCHPSGINKGPANSTEIITDRTYYFIDL